MAIHFNGNSNPDDASVNDTGAQQNQSNGSGYNNNNGQQRRPTDGGSGQWGNLR